jgi:hypothetical protein
MNLLTTMVSVVLAVMDVAMLRWMLLLDAVMTSGVSSSVVVVW